MKRARIEVGAKVNVEIADGMKFPSIVQKVDEACNDVYISAFDGGESIENPSPGSEIKLMLQGRDCCYAMFGSIVGYTYMNGLNVMHITRNGEIERIQRRNSYRLEKSIPIDLRIYDLYDLNKLEHSVSIMSADISEGGVGFHWPEPIEIDRFLDCGISVDDDYFLMRCRVAKCINEEDNYRIGLQIIEEDEEFKDKIRKYVFDEQAK